MRSACFATKHSVGAVAIYSSPRNAFKTPRNIFCPYFFFSVWSEILYDSIAAALSTKCLNDLDIEIDLIDDTIHYNDVIMSAMAPQIISLRIVCSTVCSRRRSKEHQCSASLAFVRGIHRWPVNSPHKGPVTHKMFPFDDIMFSRFK